MEVRGSGKGVSRLNPGLLFYGEIWRAKTSKGCNWKPYPLKERGVYPYID